MKKALLLILSVCILFVTCSVGTSGFIAEAENDKSPEEQLMEEVDKTISDLELGEFEDYINNLEIFYNRGGIKAFIRDLSEGKIEMSPQNILRLLFDTLTSGITKIIPSLIGIILIAVLFSLVFGLTQNFIKKQTVEIVYFVCYTAIITTVVAIVIGTVKEIKNTITALSTIINGIYPPLITLVTALGGGTSQGLFSPGLAVVGAVTSNVVTKVVLPLFIASIVFCIVGNLSNNVKLDKLQSATRYIAGGIMTITFGGLIAYLSISGLIGGMSDTASVKATKYLVSSYVPLIGGYLSQGFDLVRVGMVIVKNALGVTGIIIVFIVILAPAIKLLALTIGLKLTAGLIEPITDKRMSGFINGVAESTRQLLGAVLGVGFVFIITISILLFTLNTI